MAEQVVSFDVSCPKGYGDITFVGKDAYTCPVSGEMYCMKCTAPVRSSADAKERWEKGEQEPF